MSDAWDKAMRSLSDLELRLIIQGAKNGTMKAVGAPENSIGAGFKAAMELNRREAGNYIRDVELPKVDLRSSWFLINV